MNYFFIRRIYISSIIMKGTTHTAGRRHDATLLKGVSWRGSCVVRGAGRCRVRYIVSGLRCRVVYRVSTSFIISRLARLCSITKVSTACVATKTVSMRVDGTATVSETVIFSKHCGHFFCNRAIRLLQLHEPSSRIDKMVKKNFFFIFFL